MSFKMKNCFNPGCKNQIFYSCSCQNPEIYFCKEHLTKHLTVESKHLVNFVVEILEDEDKKNKVLQKIEKILDELMMIEKNAMRITEKVITNIHMETLKCLRVIGESKDKILIVYKKLLKGPVISIEEFKFVNDLGAFVKPREYQTLSFLESTIDDFFRSPASCTRTLSLGKIRDSIKIEKGAKALCQHCSTGYLINCKSHIFCETCRVCRCKLCTNPKKFPEEKFAQNIDIEPSPFKTVKNPSSADISIYRGYNKTLKKNVAVMKIQGQKSENFKQTVEIMKFLSNSSLECFLWINGSFSSKKNENFIVTEYIVDSLQEKLQENFSNDQLVKIVRLLIEGFAFMSLNRIFYRNISPKNIFLTLDFIPKIANFTSALVHIVDEKKPLAKNFPYFIDNEPGYLSPERYNGMQRVQSIKDAQPYDINIEKSEVYSLGLVILELIIKRDVNEFQSWEKGMEMYEAISEIKDLSLQNIVEKMLMKDPEDRPYFKDLLNEVNSIL